MLLRQVTSFQNPTWTIFSDTNRSMAVTTRLDMLDGLVADKSLVLSYHERFPGLGYVVPMGPWYDYSYAPLTGPSLV